MFPFQSNLSTNITEQGKQFWVVKAFQKSRLFVARRLNIQAKTEEAMLLHALLKSQNLKILNQRFQPLAAIFSFLQSTTIAENLKLTKLATNFA